MATQCILYMESDGTIRPCGIVTNPLYASAPVADGKIQVGSINIKECETLGEITGSRYITSFQAFRGDRAATLRRTPCNTCDYNWFCIRCPFMHYTDEVVDECAEVFRRESQFERDVLGSQVIISNRRLFKESKETNNLQVRDLQVQRWRDLNASGSLIVRWLIGSSDPLDVESMVGRLSASFPSVPRRQMTRDSIDFVWWLNLLGVVELRHGNSLPVM